MCAAFHIESSLPPDWQILPEATKHLCRSEIRHCITFENPLTDRKSWRTDLARLCELTRSPYPPPAFARRENLLPAIQRAPAAAGIGRAPAKQATWEKGPEKTGPENSLHSRKRKKPIGP